uniref:RING-type domain-containing protein n=1 Tax=Octactis speculum TaxID=3111310 RepID=A0A7S2MBV3_9STRA
MGANKRHFIQVYAMAPQLMLIKSWYSSKDGVFVVSRGDVAVLEFQEMISNFQLRFKSKRNYRRAAATNRIQHAYTLHYKRRVFAAITIQCAFGPCFREIARKRACAASQLSARYRGLLARRKKRCGICLEQRVIGAFAVASCCPAHGFCRPCMREYLRGLIEDGRTVITCAFPLCSVELPPMEIKRLAGQQSFQKLQEQRHGQQAEYLARLGTGEENESFTAWCWNNARACPGCHVIIYRYEGCDHMKCRCGRCFNWNEAEKPGKERDGKPRVGKSRGTFYFS